MTTPPSESPVAASQEKTRGKHRREETPQSLMRKIGPIAVELGVKAGLLVYETKIPQGGEVAVPDEQTLESQRKGGKHRAGKEGTGFERTKGYTPRRRRPHVPSDAEPELARLQRLYGESATEFHHRQARGDKNVRPPSSMIVRAEAEEVPNADAKAEVVHSFEEPAQNEEAFWKKVRGGAKNVVNAVVLQPPPEAPPTLLTDRELQEAYERDKVRRAAERQSHPMYEAPPEPPTLPENPTLADKKFYRERMKAHHTALAIHKERMKLARQPGNAPIGQEVLVTSQGTTQPRTQSGELIGEWNQDGGIDPATAATALRHFGETELGVYVDTPGEPTLRERLTQKWKKAKELGSLAMDGGILVGIAEGKIQMLKLRRKFGEDFLGLDATGQAARREFVENVIQNYSGKEIHYNVLEDTMGHILPEARAKYFAAKTVERAKKWGGPLQEVGSTALRHTVAAVRKTGEVLGEEAAGLGLRADSEGNVMEGYSHLKQAGIDALLAAAHARDKLVDVSMSAGDWLTAQLEEKGLPTGRARQVGNVAASVVGAAVVLAPGIALKAAYDLADGLTAGDGQEQFTAEPTVPAAPDDAPTSPPEEELPVTDRGDAGEARDSSAAQNGSSNNTDNSPEQPIAPRPSQPTQPPEEESPPPPERPIPRPTEPEPPAPRPEPPTPEQPAPEEPAPPQEPQPPEQPGGNEPAPQQPGGEQGPGGQNPNPNGPNPPAEG